MIKSLPVRQAGKCQMNVKIQISNLNFDAVVQSRAHSTDLLAKQVLWQARASSAAKAGTLASDEL